MVHQFKFGDVYRQRYLARNHKMGKRLSPTNPSKMLTQRDECPSIDSEPTALPAGPTACARARALCGCERSAAFRMLDLAPPPTSRACAEKIIFPNIHTYVHTYILKKYIDINIIRARGIRRSTPRRSSTRGPASACRSTPWRFGHA